MQYNDIEDFREIALGITAIYPGTFDPITLGHTDIVSRAAPLFERLILAVAASTAKNTVFSADERVALAREILTDYVNVEVRRFDGLMVDFARANRASVILRGLRAVTDFEYEFQLAGMNRKLMPEADTVFLPTSENFTYISSSLVREIASLGGDVSDFVHPRIRAVLQERVSLKHK
jgi:pantetheine-phosphate adenylyltransferase